MTATLVIACFTSLNTFNLVPFAYAKTPVFSTSSGIFHHSQKALSLEIPASFGAVESSQKLPHANSSKDFVVLIQDAHAVASAQASIQNILEYLETKHRVSQVFLEGVSGHAETSLLQSSPNSTYVQEAIKTYLSRGELSGAAARALEADSAMTLQGIEDATLYEEGREIYLNALKGKEEGEAAIEKIEKTIAEKKEQVFSPELLDFDRAFLGWEKDAKFFEQLVKAWMLPARAKSPKAFSQKYPGLDAFCLHWSQGGDAKLHELEKETKSLSLFLKATVKDPALQKALNVARQDFSTEKNSLASYSLELVRILKASGRRYPLSGSLKKVYDKLAFLEKMKTRQLHQELQAWSREVYENLAVAEAEKSLLALAHQMRLEKNLSRMELSLEEWQELQINKDPKLFKAWPEMAQAFAAIDSGLAFQKKFYQNAQKREQKLLENFFKLRKQDTQKHGVFVMVAGGFHSEGFITAFQKAGIPFALVSPAMRDISDQTLYPELMKGNVSWRKSQGTHDDFLDFHRTVIEEVLRRVAAEAKGIREGEAFQKEFVQNWRQNLLRSLDRQGRLNHAEEMLTYFEQSLPEAFRKSPDLSQTRGQRLLAETESTLRNATMLPSATLPLFPRLAKNEGTPRFIEAPISIGRHELRKQDWKNQLLEGVGEPNTNWQRMNVIGGVILGLLKKSTDLTFTIQEIEGPAREKMKAQLIDGPDQVTFNTIEGLLQRMTEFGLLKQPNGPGTYALGEDVSPETFAVKTNQIRYIRADLEAALLRAEQDDGERKRNGGFEFFKTVIQSYMTATLHWPLFPVESDYPVLKAVSLLAREKQQTLVRFLLETDALIQHSRLVEKIILLVTKKAPEGWFERHASHLEGRDIIYVSSETWFPIGGLGRVGQYHTPAIKELLGEHANMITVEPMYDFVADSNGQLQAIDYKNLTSGVTDVKPAFDFKMRVRKGNERRDVTVQVFKGKRDGLDCYFMKDKPYDGQEFSYYTKVPYRYGAYEGATWAEFNEFMSKGAIILSKRIQKQKMEALKNIGRESEYKAPLLWGNDGQIGTLATFKRISDELESLPEEEKEKVLNDPSSEYYELSDLIQDPEREASLKEAFVWFTTHTFNNRSDEKTEHFLWGMRIPQKFWAYFNRRGADYDSTSGGVRMSDGVNGVAAMHVQEVRGIDPLVQILAITNGDNLLASSAVYRKIFSSEPFQNQFPNADPEFPTPEQILAAKKIAIEQLKTNQALLKLNPGFADLDPNKPVLIYTGRLVEEKAGLKRAFTEGNIRFLVQKGFQIIHMGNIQGGEYSQKKHNELKGLEQQLKSEKQPTHGCLIVASGWGVPEQVSVFAGDLGQGNDSDPITEAAGLSETDAPLSAALEITRAGLEGLYQQHGEPLDWDAGEGNVMIANADTPEAYQYVYQKLMGYAKELLRLAKHQVVGVRMAQVLDARFTAMAYLEAFDQMVDRMEHPVEALKKVASGDGTATQFTYSEWFRNQLLNELPKQEGVKVFDETPADVAAFQLADISGEGHQNIVLVEKGAHNYGHQMRGVIKGRKVVNTIFAGLSLVPDTRVQISDPVTGKVYGSYTTKELLTRGLYVDFSGVQILRIDEIKEQAEQMHRVTKATVFQDSRASQALEAIILGLIPSGLIQQAWETSLDKLVVWVDSEGFVSKKKPKQWSDQGFYVIVRKGGGRLTLDLATDLKDVFDFEARAESNRAKLSPLHLMLAAEGDILKLGLGRMESFPGTGKKPYKDAVDPAIHYWMIKHLFPFAKKLGFKTIQIEQNGYAPEFLQSLGFEIKSQRPVAKNTIWERPVKKTVNRKVRAEVRQSVMAAEAGTDTVTELLQRAVQENFGPYESLGESIKELVENKSTEAINALFDGVSKLTLDEAKTVFGEEPLPAIMTLVSVLAPNYLDRMRPWDQQYYFKLERIRDSENKRNLFWHGQVTFHPTDNPSGFAISKTDGKRRIFFVFDFLRHDNAQIQDKTWFHVQGLTNDGIVSSGSYQVYDHIFEETYKRIQLGSALLGNDGWSVGISQRAMRGEWGIRWVAHVQILEFVSVTAKRLELRQEIETRSKRVGQADLFASLPLAPNEVIQIFDWLNQRETISVPANRLDPDLQPKTYHKRSHSLNAPETLQVFINAVSDILPESHTWRTVKNHFETIQRDATDIAGKQIVMDWMDVLKQWLAYQVWEGYFKAANTAERIPFSRILQDVNVRMDLITYLSHHPEVGVELQSSSGAVRLFQMVDQPSKVMAVSTEAYEQNGNQSWTSLSNSGNLQSVIGKSDYEDLLALIRIKNAITGEDYGLHPVWRLRLGLPIGVPKAEGVQVLQFTKEETSDWGDIDLKLDSVAGLLHAAAMNEYSNENPLTLLSRILAEAQKESGFSLAGSDLFANLRGLEREDAYALFGDKVSAVMTLVRVLARTALGWDDHTAGILSQFINEFENSPDKTVRNLFNYGKITFHETNEPHALVFSIASKTERVFFALDFSDQAYGGLKFTVKDHLIEALEMDLPRVQAFSTLFGDNVEIVRAEQRLSLPDASPQMPAHIVPPAGELSQQPKNVLAAMAREAAASSVADYQKLKNKLTQFSSSEAVTQYMSNLDAYLEESSEHTLNFSWVMPNTDDENVLRWLEGFLEQSKTLVSNFSGRYSVSIGVADSKLSPALSRLTGQYPEFFETVSQKGRRNSGMSMNTFFVRHPNALYHGLSEPLQNQIRADQQFRAIETSRMNWEAIFPLLTILYGVTARSSAVSAEDLQKLLYQSSLDAWIQFTHHLVVSEQARQWIREAQTSELLATMA